MPRRIAAALTVVITASAAIANAQGSPADMRNAEALATEGKVYFRTKLYDKAADKFMQAFGISKRPALLYNAARAYEEAKKLPEAIAMFEHYKTVAADDRGKLEAQKKIDALKARQKREEAAAAAAAANAATQKRAADAAAAKQKAAKAKTASGKTKSGDTSKAAGTKTTTGTGLASGRFEDRQRVFPLWRSVGSGTLLLFAGAAYANAYRIATDVRPDDVIDDTTREEYKANQSSAGTWQIISISAAVAGVGVGAWAAWDWWQSGKPKPAVTLAPLHGGRGLALIGRF